MAVKQDCAMEVTIFRQPMAGVDNNIILDIVYILSNRPKSPIKPNLCQRLHYTVCEK